MQRLPKRTASVSTRMPGATISLRPGYRSGGRVGPLFLCPIDSELVVEGDVETEPKSTSASDPKRMYESELSERWLVSQPHPAVQWLLTPIRK